MLFWNIIFSKKDFLRMKKSGQRREELSQIKYSDVISTPTSLLCILECHNFYLFLIIKTETFLYYMYMCINLINSTFYPHIQSPSYTLLLHIVLDAKLADKLKLCPLPRHLFVIFSVVCFLKKDFSPWWPFCGHCKWNL